MRPVLSSDSLDDLGLTQRVICDPGLDRLAVVWWAKNETRCWLVFFVKEGVMKGRHTTDEKWQPEYACYDWWDA
jgi:hypothetical protein